MVLWGHQQVDHVWKHETLEDVHSEFAHEQSDSQEQYVSYESETPD